jgi:hypothetical protein
MSRNDFVASLDFLESQCDGASRPVPTQRIGCSQGLFVAPAHAPEAPLPDPATPDPHLVQTPSSGQRAAAALAVATPLALLVLALAGAR